MYYFHAETMTVATYGKLMDTGFRRSGIMLYKPDLRNTCCPQYTIRLDVNKVQVSKDQRKVLRKFNRFACGGECGVRRDSFDLRYEVHLADGGGSIEVEPQTTAKTRGRGKFEPLVYKTCRPDFEVKLLSAQCTSEKYELYKKYQVAIHHEKPKELSRDGFESFLCASPFPDQPGSADDEDVAVELDFENVKQQGGLVHQGYYYNGQLIAMAVLDVIPQKCVSAVYFMWDPLYKSLDLGKVGALREIVLAQDLGVPYYYLGFYIPGCPKMKYKSEYKPSELLDPQSLPGRPQWFDLDKMEKAQDQWRYATMLGPPAIPEEDLGIVKLDKAHPTRYFALQLPGVIASDEVLESDIWKTKLCLTSGADNTVLKLTLKELYQVYPLESLFNIAKEMWATLGPISEQLSVRVQ